MLCSCGSGKAARFDGLCVDCYGKALDSEPIYGLIDPHDYSDFTGDHFPEEASTQYGDGGYKYDSMGLKAPP